MRNASRRQHVRVQQQAAQMTAPDAGTLHSSSGFNGNAFARMVIESACNRVQKDLEDKAQHGEVRIIMKDGKLVEP